MILARLFLIYYLTKFESSISHTISLSIDQTDYQSLVHLFDYQLYLELSLLILFVRRVSNTKHDRTSTKREVSCARLIAPIIQVNCT